MKQATPRGRAERILLAVAIALPCAALAWSGLRDLDLPGLYYDEVIQAEPAVQFLAEAGEPAATPGMRYVRLFGGWFPVMTQSYMGALKSQLLIPVFAAAGATPAVLRATTLVWCLAALGLLVLWTRRLLGLPGALLAAMMLASDAGFLFIGRHDWGSFALGLLCRCGGLLLISRGWSRRAIGPLFAGGLCLGLGVYNKADFVVFLAAALPAALIAIPALRVELFGPRRRDAGIVGGGLVLGAAPLLANLGPALHGALARAGGGIGDPAELGEKLATMRAMFDGSYFQRLMLCGGAFPRLFEVQGAAAGWFLPVFVLAALTLAVVARRRSERTPTEMFLLLTTLLTMAWILLLPDAVRIHHAMNVLPFPQLVVAAAAVRLWRVAVGSGRAQRALVRALVIVAVLAAIGGNLRVTRSTWGTIHETGGRGFWSDATARLVRDVENERDLTVVSLDWGFHLPLAFLSSDLRLQDPSWRMRDASSWAIPGDRSRLYLVWADEFGLFPYGRSLLARVRAMPPGVVRLVSYTDRQGTPAFYSVRFATEHRLVWDGELRVLFDER